MTGAAQMSEAAPPIQLPSLRQELRIEPGSPQLGGAPSWTLFDPIRHAFYRIGRIEHLIFSNWARGSFETMGADLAGEGLSEEEANRALHRVVDFSLEHQLVVSPLGDGVAAMQKRRDMQRRAWWKWMLDNYLFFRIPLVRPASRLQAAMKWLNPFWSLRTIWFFAGLIIMDIILVSRQWDAFASSFLYFFTWKGVLAYLLGLSAVKVIHELGHALTATRYGCRVASMGVSFLVMMPVLYTDTTSAWRLRSRRQRIAIDCAGVAAELMTAAICTFVWLWLPDGPLRSVVFILATSSWLLSLMINLSPFTRFDGYYVLSDLIGVPNLQQRSFALGRWRLRELLFGLKEPQPEPMTPRLRRFLIAYAWATWIYRLILFFGIALLVYHFFFKLLGVLLFIVEVGVFIARPIWSELRAWHERGGSIIKSPRGRLTLGLAGLGLIALALPLDRTISAPALLVPLDAEPLVSGEPARVESIRVRDGQAVSRGDVIAELNAPSIAVSQEGARARIAALEAQLARAASDREDRSNLDVLQRQLAVERAKLAGAGELSDRLVLRAPIDGVIADLRPQIHSGRWLAGDEIVAYVVRTDRADVQAYIDENDLSRVDDQANARFLPDDIAQSPRAARLVETGRAAIQTLDQPLLASVNGGPIAVVEGSNSKLIPRDALYRLRFIASVEDEADRSVFAQPIPGTVVIDADGRSVLGSMARWLAGLFRSEASIS